jgi:hypothetical protein
MSKNPIVIHLPNPCGQNWDEMTPMGMGKLCANCQTLVIDFTTWSDESLFAYFKRNTGDICGLYYLDQVDRPIIEPKQRSKFYRIAVAMGLTLLAVQPSQLQARPRPPLIECNTYKEYLQADDDTLGTPTTLTGTVYGANNKPAADLYVEIVKDKGIASEATTDSKGVFEVTLLSEGIYTVNIYFGSKIELTRKITIVEGQANTAHFILKHIPGRFDHSRGMIMGKKMPEPKK